MDKTSPKKRDAEKTRAHILQVAFAEIYARGYQGVGVREIAEKADVTIGAFFHHFPSKNDVALAIVDEVIRPGILERWLGPLAECENPVMGILTAFKKTFAEWPDAYVRLGCPLNNLTQEMTPVDQAVRQKTEELLKDWIAGTRKYLQIAQKNGYLRKDADTLEAARFIVTLQEGAFAMGKALGDRKIYNSLYRSLETYLQALSID